jgi:hypothetical protein
MKKKLLLSFVTLLSCVVASLSFIWIIIESIASWLSDTSFNFWCVWSFLISVVVTILSSYTFHKLPIERSFHGTMEEANKKMAFNFQHKIQFPDECKCFGNPGTNCVSGNCNSCGHRKKN